MPLRLEALGFVRVSMDRLLNLILFSLIHWQIHHYCQIHNISDEGCFVNLCSCLLMHCVGIACIDIG